MSDTEVNTEIDLGTVKKRKNAKNVDKQQDEDAKKKDQMDTVKIGQNKKEMPKKKKSSSKESLVSSVSEQKNQQKKAAKNNNKKALKNLDEEVIGDENTDESDSDEQIAKEDISTCDQKPKGGKGAKKEQKANNKNKYSVQDYQTLIDYMKNSNKPFNATTLESNLKGKTQFKKGSIEAALSQAVEEKYIVRKAYGSAYVFWYNQELLPVVNKEEIEQLTNEILNKQKEASEVNQKLRNLVSQLSKVMQEKTNDQLQLEIEKFKQQIFQLDQDMQYFTSESFIPEDSNVVRQIEDKLAKIEGIFKKRKRTCEEAVKDLLENQEESISLQQMFQTIGIDEADNSALI
ncbi:TBP1 interacting protein (macronuclear) [Tetrahymena thermophila SB210]|uniref:TBP1 interacting protein n=1 Tax=Tetrahymena thermophila (strain SB210) TaxID=312017 RepID=Q23VW9_TETTS|nr:TBP1 interacting protein [Tetrahymena thermophila SB210]EAS00736.3 TBP1 interacting protein [Tetrahymena thermophila SB210]|eukprot:XP_001020981.3 TBP1 interacting protein [Tetrahymena thermophila SB210]